MENKIEHKWYRLHFVLSWISRVDVASKIHLGLNFLFVAVLALVTAMVSFQQNVKPSHESTPSWARWLHEIMSEASFPVFAVIITVQSIIPLIKWIISRRQSDNNRFGKLYHNLLNDLVDDHFKDRTESGIYRATLFQAKGNWFIGRYLAIIARSGTAFQNSKTVFSIHPSKEHRNTGRAGYVWWLASNLQNSVDIFCVKEGMNTPENGRIPENLSEMVNLNAHFYSSAAIIVNGKPWGVLVVDSDDCRLGGEVSQQKASPMKKAINKTATTVSYVVESSR